MHKPERQRTTQHRDPPPAARSPLADHTPPTPPSAFICPGCGRPLAITLCSEMCFAEAQVYCPDCERDYQKHRGRWAEQ